MEGRTAGADATMGTPVRLKANTLSESYSPDSILLFDFLEPKEKVPDSRRATANTSSAAIVEVIGNIAFTIQPNCSEYICYGVAYGAGNSSGQVAIICCDSQSDIDTALWLVDSGKCSTMIPGTFYYGKDLNRECLDEGDFEVWIESHSINEVVQCITSGDFNGDTIWDIRGGRPTDKSHRSALLKALPSLFVDHGEPMPTNLLDIIDEPIDSSSMTERPPLELSAAAEPAETFSAPNPNSHQAFMFPISASQIDLQVEVSVHPEPPFGELSTKPLDIERDPPEFAFSPDAAIDPKPPAKPPDANEASDALEFETIMFAVAIERKPPEFTLWTFPSDLATKPRAKPPNDAPKPMPPPEPPDSDSSIGVPFAAYFPHGGDHGTIFPGA